MIRPKFTIVTNINRKKPVLDKDLEIMNLKKIPLPNWIELIR